jgi:putative ATP-dependent endonuclease of OLD family
MNNIIKNLYVSNFRGLEFGAINDCGPLNILIGKNNAGKSSLLAAIPILFEHLAEGGISATWKALRPKEEFTNRETQRDLQLGIELRPTKSQKDELCKELYAIAPHLDKGIEAINSEDSISFIFRFILDEWRTPYQYIESISFGGISLERGVLTPKSTLLLQTTKEATKELHENFLRIEELDSNIQVIESAFKQEQVPWEAFFDEKKRYPINYLVDSIINRAPVKKSNALNRNLKSILESSDSFTDFKAKGDSYIDAARDEIERISSTDILTPFLTFTGLVRVQPSYITNLCLGFGRIPILRLGERKTPIGKREATQLLQLKVTRGGPERLSVVQQTVKSLLGVSLDAFQAEASKENAEIDVDDFLAEANGAGIRESLRLILDLELERCDIVLIEEPEVHLHPGLEFAVHSYLQEKSKTKQFFVTTHSTNFVDAVSPQHIYLIARGENGISTCSSLTEGDVPLKLPAELGIRLSTVFMFDRIVFVEGPSDESVMRELASINGIDLNGSGVAFVHMGGVANFTHYAAESTLDLLSRRRVKMWFIIDKDERDGTEIDKMVERLGDKAELFVLQRRELENFLIEEKAICAFVKEKSGIDVPPADYKIAVDKAVEAVVGKVSNLYVEKKFLSPIYLRGKNVDGDVRDRLKEAVEKINVRMSNLEGEIAEIELHISTNWNLEKAIQLVPGELLIQEICKTLGCSFHKARGDSVKLAKHMTKFNIPKQISDIFNSIVSK